MNRHLVSLEFDKVLAMLAEYTVCDEARELALEFRPVNDLAGAQALLNQTRDAHMLLARFGAPSFGGLRSVNNALRRAQAGSTLSMRELLDVAELLRCIRSVVQWRSTNAGVPVCLDVLFDALTPNKFLEDSITTAIISEEEMADNASPELYDIRRKIRVQQSKVRESLEKIVRSAKYKDILQESIITMRNGRYVLPVKSEQRGSMPGLVHDTSSSGATVFVEPMSVVEANNEIKVLMAKERDEIERILCELSVAAGSFADSIKNSFDCAVELNVIFAKAKLAYAMDASVPLLNNEGITNLRRARHPLLDKKTAVPVDIRLGGEFETLIITGPNTGGKTVSIKTLGLLTVMAMCGLMLPVNDMSEVAVCTKVLADIGDEQSIEQSLSTFSSHMKNIIEIIATADSQSLVLIDELGAGTDPVEGAALAMAILEKLHANRARIAATTHYAELKAYALQTPGVENGCCEFDVTTLKPTYRLLIGVPGRSNAFAISERLGMDADIVERARDLVSTENTRFESVVETLEVRRRELENEIEKARAELEQAKLERERAERRSEGIEEKKNKEIEAAKAQAAKIVDQAKREAYTLLQQLEMLKKEKDKAQDIAELTRRARASVKRGIEAMDSAADPVTELAEAEEYVLPRALKIGDKVVVAGIGREGTVLELPDKNGNTYVMVGTARMRAKLSDLRLLEKGAKKQQPGALRTVANKAESRGTLAAETRLDMRGMTVDDALIELDRFIDAGLRTGLTEFTIIHGKGTGALRAATQDYLRKCSAVKSFRLGVFGEGENGVTIVELK